MRPPVERRRNTLVPALETAALLSCASSYAREPDADYLHYVTVEVPISEHVLIRWPMRDLPLRVHLPPPPEGLFPDPEAIEASVRDGVTAPQS